jgi:hypothetical protein
MYLAAPQGRLLYRFVAPVDVASRPAARVITKNPAGGHPFSSIHVPARRHRGCFENRSSGACQRRYDAISQRVDL